MKKVNEAKQESDDGENLEKAEFSLFSARHIDDDALFDCDDVFSKLTGRGQKRVIDDAMTRFPDPDSNPDVFSILTHAAAYSPLKSERRFLNDFAFWLLEKTNGDFTPALMILNMHGDRSDMKRLSSIHAGNPVSKTMIEKTKDVLSKR